MAVRIDCRIICRDTTLVGVWIKMRGRVKKSMACVMLVGIVETVG